MKIFAATQVREIDLYTIENESIESFFLMERAAAALTDWYVRHYSIDRKVLIFAGTGNNGGDGLALARMLAERRYRVQCILFGSEERRSTDSRRNLELLQTQGLVSIEKWSDTAPLMQIPDNAVLVDALFGSGLNRPLDGPVSRLISHINNSGTTIISIDIPSGLFGENNEGNSAENIVRSTITLTFQFPFLSMLLADNHNFVPSWRVLDIGLHPEIINRLETPYQTLTRKDVAALLPKRSRFAHKGTCGHACVIAGSYGMMGAAVLAGGASLRGGAGLVSMHIPRKGYDIIQLAIPEALVSLDQDDTCFSRIDELDSYTALAAGPGLGKDRNTIEGLRALLERVRIPLILDADALNIIASEPGLLDLVPKDTVITPHPGEFDRLFSFKGSSYERLQEARKQAIEHELVIVLKGAWSAVIAPDGQCRFNTTGNPGMATGGSGDVLSGLIVSFLAQGLNAFDAACAACFLHGQAGDLAAEEEGEASLVAGDIIRYIGKAWKWTEDQNTGLSAGSGKVLNLKED